MKGKAYIAIFLAIAYVGVTFQSALPWLEYGIHQKFITENLCVQKNDVRNCCKGKCYLKQQVKENESRKDEQGRNKITVDVFQFVCLPSEEVKLELPGQSDRTYHELIPFSEQQFVTRVWHPPVYS